MRRGMLKEHSSLFFILVCLVELVLVASSGFLGHWFELGSLSYDTNMDSIEAILLGVILAAIVFPLCRVYAPLRGQTIGTVFRRILCAWGLVICYLVLIAFFTHRTEIYTRGFLLSWAMIGVVFLLAYRLLLITLLGYLRSHEHNLRRVVVIGAGSLGERIVCNLEQHLWTGYRVVGFLDDNEQKIGQSIRGHRVYKMPRNLEQWLADNAADEVWLTLPLYADQRIKELLYEMRHNALTVRLVPDIFCFSLLNHSPQNIAGLPTLNLKTSPIQGINRLLKAIEDRVFAIGILILVSPLMLGIAILVKLGSKGPVFFKQKRYGCDGREIEIYKFRSMIVHQELNGKVTQASRNDDRITPIGSFLRRMSLDELPQFINVLKGDMSIVGPRPHAIAHNEEYKDLVDQYMQRHLVKPGITGWAQVSGFRGETDTVDKMEKRVQCDLYYIRNWSLWFDIKIIFKTILNGFIHKNAY
ncbi:UDP-glucose:undecaprenyl-phosphate glucose-1-phosphate transferase [Piscirickettsia salmonis]|uniref:undecaprenyl-phosphate glucose phosphotransferase n=1 Tax=Piscirickettsia salmonis TaxID=1238 RepID=UPI0012BA8976|nr:undecaprenyl-phosphate glucose phosphotransferase [Piscirickettsia salmonis]QGP52738.1 UDP-glucose:undecaprenyl-phosphate glucose-1-phosphate transferase [Piscirickettsia salmonis]QGP57601.1 UDP-glucose:undecaprenyl-phosphate glucose-1-phosphate transferase [Piscirickettsia salmonis]QGP62306.1 UDP-glucose:undecaprenyl-phosphate glucose-1-phosphate transferase [Piscirickettsia salmonis]